MPRLQPARTADIDPEFRASVETAVERYPELIALVEQLPCFATNEGLRLIDGLRRDEAALKAMVE